jgi:hypothetical protein
MKRNNDKNTLYGLKKKLKQLERKYARAAGKHIMEARILKSAEAVQNKIDKLEGVT